MRSSVALPRVVAQPTVVEDNGQKITLKQGQHIICNLVSNQRIKICNCDHPADDIFRSRLPWTLSVFQSPTRLNSTVT